MFGIDGGKKCCDLVFIIVGKEVRSGVVWVNTVESGLGCIVVGYVEG